MPDSISSFGELIAEAATIDLALCLNDLNLFASFDLDADGALILDDHAAREALDQTHVFALQRRPQIGVGGRPAAAAMDGLLHRAEAFLLRAVIVLGQLEAGLAAGLDEGGVERIACAGRAAHAADRRCRASPSSPPCECSMRLK